MAPPVLCLSTNPIGAIWILFDNNFTREIVRSSELKGFNEISFYSHGFKGINFFAQNI
uniref:Uncharacterized protein n=1 Tax=Nelumbo nucifera TaxID=4432 RepID=A0A822YMJ6_NELNU|nr:TPA_asm: hypothetical protein HUJ06_010977 [Nelumbo nucifera]